MLLLLAGCEPAVEAVAPTDRLVELVLDRGHVEDGDWVSEPVGADHLVGETGERSWRTLPVGPGVAKVDRGCGEVDVPYVVEALGRTIVIPYPACGDPDAPTVAGVRLDRREARWDVVATGLGLWPEVPAPEAGQDNGPARYLTLAEARAWCAWNGGRLPTAAEWEAAAGPGVGPLRDGPRGVGDLDREPIVGPFGHEDVLGNVEEWLDDGRVAGGSWLQAGRLRAVPPNARAETIGVRCVYAAPGGRGGR